MYSFRELKKCWFNWFKRLKEYGIILWVRSKNNKDIAMEPFERHEEIFNELIENSRKSVAAWNAFIRYILLKDMKPTLLFYDTCFLITIWCKAETSEMYELLTEEIKAKPDSDISKLPVFWPGYPLWYHSDRYLSECMYGFRVVGSNYLIWWCLDYSGSNAYEKLFSAYNYTFLNMQQKSCDKRLSEQVRASGAKCAIVLHNKSCKCDFVSARNLELPQAELDIDMIDRTYLNIDKAKGQIDLLKETICTA